MEIRKPLLCVEEVLLILYEERREIIALLPENANEIDREAVKAQVEVIDRLSERIGRAKHYGIPV